MKYIPLIRGATAWNYDEETGELEVGDEDTNEVYSTKVPKLPLGVFVKDKRVVRVVYKDD